MQGNPAGKKVVAKSSISSHTGLINSNVTENLASKDVFPAVDLFDQIFFSILLNPKNQKQSEIQEDLFPCNLLRTTTDTGALKWCPQVLAIRSSKSYSMRQVHFFGKMRGNLNRLNLNGRLKINFMIGIYKNWLSRCCINTHLTFEKQRIYSLM